MVKAADTKWGEGPAFLPKGVQAAVLYGDPSQGRAVHAPPEGAGGLEDPAPLASHR